MEWVEIMQQVLVYRDLNQPKMLGIDEIQNLGIAYLIEKNEFISHSDILHSKFSQ
jgi:hypothetical protein